VACYTFRFLYGTSVVFGSGRIVDHGCFAEVVEVCGKLRSNLSNSCQFVKSSFSLIRPISLSRCLVVSSFLVVTAALLFRYHVFLLSYSPIVIWSLLGESFCWKSRRKSVGGYAQAHCKFLSSMSYPMWHPPCPISTVACYNSLSFWGFLSPLEGCHESCYVSFGLNL
jgi:hypothetical protein